MDGFADIDVPSSPPSAITEEGGTTVSPLSLDCGSRPAVNGSDSGYLFGGMSPARAQTSHEAMSASYDFLDVDGLASDGFTSLTHISQELGHTCCRAALASTTWLVRASQCLERIPRHLPCVRDVDTACADRPAQTWRR